MRSMRNLICYNAFFLNSPSGGLTLCDVMMVGLSGLAQEEAIARESKVSS